MIIGITGGVGSGKSTILKYLSEKYNAYVIEADKVAKDIMEPGHKAYDMIVAEFTNDILSDDNNIDRKKLAQIVFNSNEKLSKLNAIVHPQVKEEILSLIDKVNKNEPNRIIVIEAALLIEDGYKLICDTIWYVYCDINTRIERLAKSRGYSRKKSMDIINNQLSDEEFKNNTDEFIDNSGDDITTQKKIDELIKRYLY